MKGFYSIVAVSLMINVFPVMAGAKDLKNNQAEQVQKQVFLDAKISREKAIEIAKSIAGNIEGYDGPQVSRGNGYAGPMGPQDLWQIHWTKRGPQFSHIEVTVDAQTGLIRQYSRGEDNAGVSLPPKVKYEEAVETAKAFFAKYYGDQRDRFQLDSREGEDWGKILRSPQDSYEVRFVEKVNGVPFPNNQISVRVNGDGKVVGLNYTGMDQVNYEDPQGILSKEEMEKRLHNGLQMKLAYQTDPLSPGAKQDEQGSVHAAYVPSPWSSMLDAKTGEAIDYQGHVVKDQQGDQKPLAESKQADPPGKLEKPLTQEEAMKRLQQIITIPEDVTVSSLQLTEWGGHQAWGIQLEYHTGNGGFGWTGGLIDANTGEVLQLDLMNYLREKSQEQQEKKTYSVTLEQAKDTAIAFLQENSKDKLHQLYFSGQPVVEPTDTMPFYRFQLDRQIGGVLVPAHQVSVTVSAETGKVVQFTQNWGWNLKLPDTANVIAPAQAKDLFLQNVKMNLEYQVLNEKELYHMANPRKETKPVEAKLVYRIQQDNQEPVFLEASSGKWISLKTGKEMEKKNKENPIQDIKGHWAEQELNYLAEIGALQAEDGKVHPDEKMTRGQFMNMFMGIFDGYSHLFYYPGGTKEYPSFKDVASTYKYFGPIEWAVERGILKKAEAFRPDDPITREEAASIVADALGYSKLAENAKMFRQDFLDQSSIDFPGPVAIVDGLGIITGSDGKFSPDRAMTRAEAAVTLFRFQQKRVEYRPDIRF
jgi:Zn-dependent metalloprotease